MVISKKQIKGYIKTAFMWIAWTVFIRIITKALWMFITEWSSFKTKYSKWQYQALNCNTNNDIARNFDDTCTEAEKNLRIWPIVYAAEITLYSFPSCIEYNCGDILYWISGIFNPLTSFLFGIPASIIGIIALWFILSRIWDSYQIYSYNKINNARIEGLKKQKKLLKNTKECSIDLLNAPYEQIYPKRENYLYNNK